MAHPSESAGSEFDIHAVPASGADDTTPDRVATLRVLADRPIQPWRWTWQLTFDDETHPESPQAVEHPVELDPHSTEFEAFTGLHRWLRWRSAPFGGMNRRTELMGRIGTWLGAQVLGPVAARLVRLAPVTVRVLVPQAAGWLWDRPLDAATIAGQTLAEHSISLVFAPDGPAADDPTVPPPRTDDDATDLDRPSRILAAFSRPEATEPLALRRERQALTHLVTRLATSGRHPVELRIVQYGVTRQQLADLVTDPRGWDVVHLSGHGRIDGLTLEDAAGRPDHTPAEELVTLLLPLRGRVRLIVLSSCSSAAESHDQARRDLGLVTSRRAFAPDGVPSLARHLMTKLDTAVLAMRYPVGDDFAVRLAEHLYTGLLDHGLPLPAALRRAVPAAAEGSAAALRPEPLAPALPVLLGSTATGLRVAAQDGPAPAPPAGDRVAAAAPEPPEPLARAGVPAEPTHFVGRSSLLTRALAALGPDQPHRAVLLTGLPGLGKRTCAAELVHRAAASGRFTDWHWYDVDDRDLDAQFAQWTGSLVPDAAAPTVELLRARLARQPSLIVVTGAHRLFDADNNWRHPGWAQWLHTLCRLDTASRTVVTADVEPIGLLEPSETAMTGEAAASDADDGTAEDSILLLRLTTLSPADALLLARDLPRLGAFLRHPDATVRTLTAEVVAAMGGDPTLLHHLEEQADDDEAFHAALHWTSAQAAVSPRDEAIFPAGSGGHTRVAELATLTTQRIGGMPQAIAMVFAVACLTGSGHRSPRAVRAVLRGTATGPTAQAWERMADLLLRPLGRMGLLMVAERPDGTISSYDPHPVVREAGLDALSDEIRHAAANGVLSYWLALLDQAYQPDDEGREDTRQFVLAGRAVLPILIDFGKWRVAAELLEALVARGMTEEEHAEAVRAAERLVAAAAVGPDREAACDALGTALAGAATPAAERRLRELLTHAVESGEVTAVDRWRRHLAWLLWKRGRVDEATTLAGAFLRDAAHTGAAGAGAGAGDTAGPDRPDTSWAELAAAANDLHWQLVHGAQEAVLDEASRLLARLDAADPDSAPDGFSVAGIREQILSAATHAALRSRRWRRALALGAQLLEMRDGRGADPNEIARTRFNLVAARIGLGQVDAARDTLVECRSVFEGYADHAGLLALLPLMAETELLRGNRADAIELQYAAIEAARRVPAEIGLLVTALGNLSPVVGDPPPPVVLDCDLATVVLTVGLGDQRLHAQAHRQLVRDLGHTDGGWDPPDTAAELLERLAVRLGIDLSAVFDQLPVAGADLDTILMRARYEAAVAAAEHPVTRRPNLEHIAKLMPLLLMVRDTVLGNAKAAEAAEAYLEVLDQERPELGRALRAVQHGIHPGRVARGVSEFTEPFLETLADLIESAAPAEAEA